MHQNVLLKREIVAKKLQTPSSKRNSLNKQVPQTNVKPSCATLEIVHVKCSKGLSTQTWAGKIVNIGQSGALNQISRFTNSLAVLSARTFVFTLSPWGPYF